MTDKFTVNKINITKTKIVETTFSCPIELRDRLEQICNDYNGKYSVTDIMNTILDDGLKKYGY